jgi:hypothetical protein
MEIASNQYACSFRMKEGGVNNLQSVELVTQYKPVKI